MDLFSQTTLEDTVKIHPRDLSKQFKTVILQKLKLKYEGHCSKFGLIVPDTIALESVLRNEIELHSFHGFALYDVRFTATICNPSEGSVVTARVANMNSFAVLCYAGNIEHEEVRNAVEIIVPRQVSNIVRFANDTTHPMDQVRIGDRVNVEIIGKKHQLGAQKIAAIGRLVDHLSPAPNKSFVTEDDAEATLLEEDDDDEEEGEAIVSEFGDDNFSDEGSEPSLFDDLADPADEEADRDLLKADDASDVDE